MTVFLVLAALLTLGVGAAIVCPLLKARDTSTSAPSENAADLSVYKSQLAEVDRDLERGLIDDGQADALRIEIKRRILAAAKQTNAGKDTRTDGKSPMAAALVLAFLIGGAGVTYYVLGNPGMPDRPYAARMEAMQKAGMPNTDGGMSDMAEKLRKRLEADGGDMEGWLLLARTYEALGRTESSLQAFSRAVDVSGRNPTVLSAYGGALIAASGGTVTKAARSAFAEVLSKDPGDVRARFFMGQAKVEDGDLRGALQDWVDLIADAPDDAPWKEQIQEQVNGLAAKLEIDPTTLQPSRHDNGQRQSSD